MVNLYQLHFPSSHFSSQLRKKKFIPPLFFSSNSTQMKEN